MPHLTIAFLAFAAAVTLVYWVVPEGYRAYVLALSGSVFLLSLDPPSFALLFVLTIITFVFAKDSKWNLLILAFLVLLFCALRILVLSWRFQNLPVSLVFLGFAFYFLKMIHYVVEMRARSFRPHRFLDFYNYMLFFPTVTVGPIHRFEDFLKSQRRVRWNAEIFANGLQRILYGYVKVIVLANWFVAQLMLSFAVKLPSESATRIFIDSVIYGFHLYFAFAGYSDIAIGLSLLLGYRICENFNWPFLKRNIGEFWQSWHMSLSAWCRQYVFMPVYSTWRNLGAALLASMVAIGMWHEFSARYLLWGIYHGLGLLTWRLYQRYIHPKVPAFATSWIRTGKALSVFLTFLFVMIGFTIPRSSSIAEIIHNFQKMFGG